MIALFGRSMGPAALGRADCRRRCDRERLLQLRRAAARLRTWRIGSRTAQCFVCPPNLIHINDFQCIPHFVEGVVRVSDWVL